MRKRNFEFLILNFKFLVSILSAQVLLGFLSPASAGQFDLGAQFQGWNSNYLAPANFSGYEVWAPISLNFKLAGGLNLYAQSEFGNAGYTDSLTGTPSTTYLTGFSDTVAGLELNFKSFSLPSILNIGFNIPSGDPTWETKQVAANIPTDLVDSRYRGRGFGVSGMYALSFPAGSGAFGAALGYAYAGEYNPTGILGSANELKLSDTLFLALNHFQPFSENRSQVIRLSAFTFLPTRLGGVDIFQGGPNFNASYSWNNPKGFSFSLGGQLFLSSQRPVTLGASLSAEPHNFYGTRFFVNPSYAFGDFSLSGRAKVVLANDYAITDPFYEGGGMVFGLEPSYRLRFDEESALKLTVSFDDIIAQNAGIGQDPTINSGKTNVTYTRWTFGTNYEVRF